MSARDAILNKVRASLGAGNDGRLAVVRERLDSAPQGLIPQRGQLPDAARIDLFATQAEKVHATTERLGSYADLPAAISAYLRSKNLPASIRMGDDSRLNGADWSTQASLEILQGPSDGNDEAGLSHAFGAVAETGTLVLHSGGDNPTTVNFLPEHHLVVVDAKDVGPSRSGDIEQKMLLGAHGPRALHIMVVGG